MRALLFLLLSSPMLYGQRTDCPNYQSLQFLAVTKENNLKIADVPINREYDYDTRATVIGKVNNLDKFTCSRDGSLFCVRNGDLYTGPLPCDKNQDWFSGAKRVGKGGWENYKFIFFDGSGNFYGVTNNGDFYKGPKPNDEDVCWHTKVATKIGNGNWHQFEALFFHPKGDLYAVTKDGSFLKGKPPTAGMNWEASTTKIGNGGWQDITHFMAIGCDGNMWCVNRINGNLYRGLPPAHEYDTYTSRADHLGSGYHIYRFICLI